jgi:ABC-type transporter Mla maintaining outer membrane lipid asymmetry permease subunit MlaE
VGLGRNTMIAVVASLVIIIIADALITAAVET